MLRKVREILHYNQWKDDLGFQANGFGEKQYNKLVDIIKCPPTSASEPNLQLHAAAEKIIVFEAT